VGIHADAVGHLDHRLRLTAGLPDGATSLTTIGGSTIVTHQPAVRCRLRLRDDRHRQRPATRRRRADDILGSFNQSCVAGNVTRQATNFGSLYVLKYTVTVDS
jgi:hypothetical protein